MRGLDPLLQELRRGTREGLIRAGRRAMVLAFGILAFPGMVLGLLYRLSDPAPYPVAGVQGFVALSLLVGAAALWLARSSAADARIPPQQAALTAAMQLGSAPAVPFLLGCLAFHQPSLWAGLWLLAALFFWLAQRQWPQLVRPR